MHYPAATFDVHALTHGEQWHTRSKRKLVVHRGMTGAWGGGDEGSQGGAPGGRDSLRLRFLFWRGVGGGGGCGVECYCCGCGGGEDVCGRAAWRGRRGHCCWCSWGSDYRRLSRREVSLIVVVVVVIVAEKTWLPHARMVSIMRYIEALLTLSMSAMVDTGTPAWRCDWMRSIWVGGPGGKRYLGEGACMCAC
ncbi:hypothetical protein BDR22DRAFT_844315 [Usnea florida]